MARFPNIFQVLFGIVEHFLIVDHFDKIILAHEMVLSFKLGDLDLLFLDIVDHILD